MPSSIPIPVAHGDGIGPEIVAAALHILKEAGAALDIETLDAGEKVYLCGNTTGIRFMSADKKMGPSQAELNALAGRVTEPGLDIGMTVSLRSCDGKAGYTLAQGQ